MTRLATRFIALLLALSGATATTTATGPAPASAAPTIDGRFVSEEAFVDQIFQDFLSRSADRGGLAFWAGRLRSGATPPEVVEALLASPEFAADTSPVVRLYLSVFDRQPDLGGLRFWVGKRQAGESLTRIAEQMLGTGEFEQLTSALDTDDIVAAVYGRSLGRTPDAEGLAFWTAEIESGRRSLANFVAAVSESPEHVDLTGDRVTTLLIFLGLLERTPDADGLVYWSEQLASGRTVSSVAADFLASPEYLSRFPLPPTLRTEVVAEGLSVPWDLETLPDGSVLFTERRGALRVIVDGELRDLGADFSNAFISGETGVMGLAVDPGFASNRRVYVCQGNATPRDVRVVVWSIDEALRTATEVGPLLTGMPINTGRHGGCQLEFGPDSYLYVGTGDAATGSHPQNLGSLGGKVLRVDVATGAGAPDNPFATPGVVDNAGRVFTYGHRNVQGLSARPGTDEMWSVEHGPTVNDEVNRLVAGGNGGWNPVPGYNESVPMTDATLANVMVPAWATGGSTLALSGGEFFDHPDWGGWNGGLAVAALKNQTLRLLFFSPDGLYLGQTTVIDGQYGRLRAVHQADDGSVYVSTSRGNDLIVRLTPSSS